MRTAELNPFDRGNLEDPYGVYERLRETSPIHHIAGMGLSLVSRHADVKEAAARNEDFSSNLTALVQAGTGGNGSRSELVEMDGGTDVVDVLATADPPDHTRQRKVVGRTFREIETAGPLVGELVDEMLAPLVDRGSCDWMADFASRLPVRVIAAVLGLAQGDVDRLRQWSDDGVELLSGVADAERLAECGASVFGFIEYLRDRLDEAVTAPPDGVLAVLAEAVAAGQLSHDEAVSMALQLVSAGSDSTGNFIGSATRILAEQPAVQDAVRSDPSLIADFLEEVVRLESPFRGHFRVAAHDTSLAGVEFHEGDRLFLIWASANRDPDVFESPDEVDLHRPNPRDHFGFGWGIHRCLGAPLARLEAHAVIERLLAATPRIGRTPGTAAPSHVPSMLVRRLAQVHIDLVAAT